MRITRDLYEDEYSVALTLFWTVFGAVIKVVLVLIIAVIFWMLTNVAGIFLSHFMKGTM